MWETGMFAFYMFMSYLPFLGYLVWQFKEDFFKDEITNRTGVDTQYWGKC